MEQSSQVADEWCKMYGERIYETVVLDGQILNLNVPLAFTLEEWGELKLVSHRFSGFIICGSYAYLPLPISLGHGISAFPSLMKIPV